MVLQMRQVQQRHVVGDESGVGQVRREAQRLAFACGMDETQAGRVAIAATELARNLHRHGDGGEVLIQPLLAGSAQVIELIALDRGRGMADVDRCLTDGYSTGGTAGTGLGAVRRLSTEFDVHSIPGQGTVVMARVGAQATSRFGAISIPLAGEIECGDTWAVAFNDRVIAVLVVDGLGHGSLAASASAKAQQIFVENAAQLTPARFLELAHRGLAGGRGAAAAIAQLGSAQVEYAGVGNIAGRLFRGDSSQGLASHNGTLGVKLNRVQQFAYPNTSGSCLVMHSDGLSSRWNLPADWRGRHPAVIAGILYRDHARAHDDATVVVVS